MMNILYGAYSLLNAGLLMAGLPPFWIYTRISGRYRAHFKERLGYIDPEIIRLLPGSPRIWIHAVSLGEVRAAFPIARELKRILPRCSLILSTTTQHGRHLAEETFAKEVPLVYAPIDFIGAVRKALRRVRPHVLIFLETEIWPSWITEAARMGSKIALLNGRISVRSFGGYLKLRPLFRQVLQNVDVFSMISKEDASRIMSMGAQPTRIIIGGNAKYELLETLVDPTVEAGLRRALNLEDHPPVLIAGSTREKEEILVLDAYESILKAFPETILILAPRHVERTREIGTLLDVRGHRYQLWTALEAGAVRRTRQVVIVNTFGELFKLYSVGTVVFCGASLVPLGGQNPLEPAAWGKVVLYGPSMEDFMDAKNLLEEVGASTTVSNPDMLAEKVLWFLRHPEALKSYGILAREAVKKNSKASKNHARAVAALL
jgi:3-deoxy-D-manno-octulosonic-acid transferase